MVQSPEGKASYPRIPAKNWWDLRRRFQQSMPKKMDVAYLTTVLKLSDGAAKNLIPSIRQVGLVDDAGVPTDRATAWRDDANYAAVCEEVRQALYPDSLRDALSPPDPDRVQVERWFARDTKTGASAVSQMAAFYLLLCEADPAPMTRSSEKVPGTPRATKVARERAQRKAPAVVNRSDSGAGQKKETPADPPTVDPSVHIDIQIHIDSSASPDQIDQIFSSMAKHIYGRR